MAMAMAMMVILVGMAMVVILVGVALVVVLVGVATVTANVEAKVGGLLRGTAQDGTTIAIVKAEATQVGRTAVAVPVRSHGTTTAGKQVSTPCRLNPVNHKFKLVLLVTVGQAVPVGEFRPAR